MFQEKKIKDFFIYSSLSNNALIVLYFLLNPSITMAMLLALTIYFYIFSVLFIFFFKAFIQKKNIVYFQEFEINWNNILQNKIIYFSFILVFFLLASLAPTIGFLVKYLSFYELFIKYGITWLGLLLPWTFLNALAYLNAFYYIIKSIKREN